VVRNPVPPIPFHLAFTVQDLASTRAFYGEVLGCPEGRSTETWVDFDFFGHQLSLHVGTVVGDVPTRSQVEGEAVPMPHFGCVLPWESFHALAGRLHGAGIAFVKEPTIRFPGQPGEQATMFVRDPSGNALEFKSFRDPEGIFAHA